MDQQTPGKRIIPHEMIASQSFTAVFSKQKGEGNL
jgi:hypothetical protein